MQPRKAPNADGSTWSHRPLGRLLLDGEFVHGADLAHALTAQQSTNQQLGQILVELGRLDPADLTAILSIQRHTERLDDAVHLAAGVRLQLGEMLLAARRITPDQLNAALEAQQQSGKRLGEILVEQGLLRAGELDALLRFQHNQTAAAQALKPLQLGELLVGMGEITRQQLADALAKQAVHTHRKLGELLIEAGHLLHDGLSKALRLQQKLLVAVLIAVLSLGSLSYPANALAGSIPAQARSNIQVTATVMEVMRLNVLSQTHTVTVKAEDVARGYIDIVAGTNVEIVSNSPAGYKLDFRFQEAPFKQAEVRGLNKSVVVGAEGASISGVASFDRQPLRTHYELDYRFKVPASMPTGVYPFPLQISISNM